MQDVHQIAIHIKAYWDFRSILCESINPVRVMEGCPSTAPRLSYIGTYDCKVLVADKGASGQLGYVKHWLSLFQLPVTSAGS